MTRPPLAPPRRTEYNFFVVLVAALTLAMAAVLWPYSGTILWGAILALLFEPLYRWIFARMPTRPTFAALATVALILLLVILPLTLVAISLAQEVTGLFQRIKSGEVDFGRYFQQIVAVLPSWATGQMDRLGLADIGALQQKLTVALSTRGQALAGRAVDFGQEALDLVLGFCVAMYLLFFLLRDGREVSRKVVEAIPVAPRHKTVLIDKFTTVMRATVKGNILVAAAQGALGGLAFWVLGVHGAILWAVVMAFLSLLPAIGAALVWAPVAIYLLAIGEIWQGVALIAWGVLVIGLIDNVLRPTLVGKDTQMPDYVVLITTLGGLTLFGLNGFVIGPVIAAMFIAVWQIFTAMRSEAAALPAADGPADAALSEPSYDGQKASPAPTTPSGH
ncbi:MAG: AI-2E family transporter [Caldimonas sp.]